MRCTSRGLVAALIIGIITGFAMSACGQPLSSSVTPNGPNATATAAFAALNRKLALLGIPTHRPGTNPLQPLAGATLPPRPTFTPGPSPTPAAPACGATIAGWDEIVSKYGGFYMSNGCHVYDGQLVITTAGLNGGPGAIATYECQQADASCLSGNDPSVAGAMWSVYPSPYDGVVSIRGTRAPGLLLIEPGE